MKVLAATGNKGKLREIREILQDTDIEIISPEDIVLKIEVCEDGLTFEENAIKKAIAFRDASGLSALADDSGLCVDALGGAPGVISARFAGVDASDEQNIDKLLNIMSGKTERTAKFVCTVALAFANGRIITASGECPGRIIEKRLGAGGFGYDPVFLDEVSGLTFAELPQERKNLISHRRKALEALRDLLEKGAY